MNAAIKGHKAIGKRILFIALYASLMVLMAVIGGRDVDRSDLSGSVAVAVGRIVALWAITILLLQGITTARFSWLDQAFGYDQLIKFHRYSAVAALSLAFLHPMILVGSGLRLSGSGDYSSWAILLGSITLFGLWFLLVSSKYRGFLLLKWEAWRGFHQIAVPVALLAFVHMFAMSPDLGGGWLLRVWALLLFIRVSALSWTRLIRPIFTAKQCLYNVSTVKNVAENITEVTLRRADGNRTFQFLPGQFMFIRFKGDSVPAEEHPFTISSSPDLLSDIQMVAKHCGDFSNQIDQLKPGDSAVISGPHGGFTPWRFGFVEHLIFVAGGIGITPLLSILRTLAQKESAPRLTLVWSNRNYNDLPYREELDRLKKSCRQLSVTHVITRGEDSPLYITGRLNKSIINKLCPDWSNGTHVMLCGPETMIRDLRKVFQERGYPARTLHSELFAL